MTTQMMVEFERSVLGHILDDNAYYHEAAEHLSTTDFSLTSHQTIFAAVASVIEAGETADCLTVGEYLTQTGEISGVGGCAYLHDLTIGLVRGHSIRDYVGRILAASLRRRIGRTAEWLTSEAAEDSNDPHELISLAEERLLGLRVECVNTDASLPQRVSCAMARIRAERARSAELLGLSTGLPELDKVTRGIQPGEIWIVGSGSGHGKTAALVQVTIANCSAGVPVQIFSLEMTGEQILRRILAAVSGVSFYRIRDPRESSPDDMAAIERAAATIEKWPLHIEDACGLTIAKLIAKARLAVRRYGVKLIGVDYVQIVMAPGKEERLRVAAISRALTALAKDVQVPVVALSQLARADRSSPNRRPRMSDLRESSQLENDGHVVILLHRETEGDFGELSVNGELILAKQRSGQTGAFPVVFDKRSLMFAITRHSAQNRRNAS